VIEAIRHLKEINGKPILVIDDLRETCPEKFNESGAMNYEWFEKEIRPKYNIYVRHDVESISFNMLTKPAEEGGDLNKCQVMDLVTLALEMLKFYQKEKPCLENSTTISFLEKALLWQEVRTQDRILRKVEGKRCL